MFIERAERPPRVQCDLLVLPEVHLISLTIEEPRIRYRFEHGLVAAITTNALRQKYVQLCIQRDHGYVVY